jgi:hypothetical protein
MYTLSQTFRIVAGFLVAIGVVIGVFFGSAAGPQSLLACTKEPLYQLVPAFVMVLVANFSLARKYKKHKKTFDSMFVVFAFLALVYGVSEYYWLSYLITNTMCGLNFELLWAPILCIDGAVLGLIVSDFELDGRRLKGSFYPDRRKIVVALSMTLLAVLNFMVASCTAFGLGMLPGYCRYIIQPSFFWAIPVTLAWLSFPVTWIMVAFGLSLFLSALLFFAYWYVVSAFVFLIYDEVKFKK